MKKLFKNARFGMPYQTRSLYKAIFIRKDDKSGKYKLLVEINDEYIYVDQYGRINTDMNIDEPTDNDIVSTYDTTEEKLDILACEQYPYKFNRSEFDTFENIKMLN